jgi:hypothetical protein
MPGDQLKIGDLVRSTTPGNVEDWIGLIIGYDRRGVGEEASGDFIVYWSNKFPDEIEYAHQLEVLSGSS